MQFTHTDDERRVWVQLSANLTRHVINPTRCQALHPNGRPCEEPATLKVTGLRLCGFHAHCTNLIVQLDEPEDQ